MTLLRLCSAVILIALLPGCGKDAPPRPAAGSSSQAPQRHVGPSATTYGKVRPPPRSRPDRAPAGQLPDDEVWQERAERPTRADRVAEFDSDGDGELSDDERDTMRQTRIDERIGRIDQDGDGEINPAELEASPRGGAGIDFATADTDGNGTLSRQELGSATRGQRLDGRIDSKRRRWPSRDGAAAGGEPADAGVRR